MDFRVFTLYVCESPTIKKYSVFGRYVKSYFSIPTADVRDQEDRFRGRGKDQGSQQTTDPKFVRANRCMYAQPRGNCSYKAATTRSHAFKAPHPSFEERLAYR